MSAEGRSNVQGNEQLTAGHDMDGHGVNRLGRSRAQFSGGLWLSWDGGSFLFQLGSALASMQREVCLEKKVGMEACPCPSSQPEVQEGSNSPTRKAEPILKDLGHVPCHQGTKVWVVIHGLVQ